MKRLKCQKFIIETDGTTGGTKISVNGELIGHIQKIGFEANIKDPGTNP